MSKSDFDLRAETDRYVSRLTNDIFSKKKRDEIKKEYSEHIEDAVYRYKLSGFGDKEAFLRACEDLGDVSKTGFLLSELHNNKLQLFFIQKILKKLRAIFSSKRFLLRLVLFSSCAIIILLLAFLFFTLFISVLGGDTFFAGTVDFLARFVLGIEFFITLLIIIVPLFFLFPLLALLYPYWHLFFERCKRYPALMLWCLRRGYSFKIKRFRFGSSYKVEAIPNVTVKKRESVYHLHFLDIPRGDKKVLVILNNKEYRVYRTEKLSPGSIIKNKYHTVENEDIPKIFRGNERIMNEERYLSFLLPEYPDNDGIHILSLIHI